jgi:hypothetical protein
MKVLLKMRAEREKPSLALIFQKFKELGFPTDLIDNFVRNKFTKTPEQIQDHQIARYL